MPDYDDGLVEAVAKALRENIKADASGLAPAIAHMVVVGFDEAARAAIAAVLEWQDAKHAESERLTEEITGEPTVLPKRPLSFYLTTEFPPLGESAAIEGAQLLTKKQLQGRFK